MSEQSQAVERHEDQVHLGPPARFDAEPVRRPNRRWIFVLCSVFLAIVAAVGIAVWRGKAYFAGVRADMAAKEKQNQEASTASRTRKLFEAQPPADPALPAGFGKGPTEVPALTPAVQAVGHSGDGAPAQPPLQAEAPVKRSMLIEVAATPNSTNSEAEPVQAAAVSAALKAAGVGGTDTGTTSLTSITPSASGGTATPPRPRSVQEQARRAASNALTATAQASAANLGNRNYLLARGGAIPCTLQTQLNSNVPGPVRCITSQDIYSDDGRVLLVEKGSGIDGEFRNTLKNGDSRIAILWNRIKTPNGVVIDIDSPATDAVGTTGVAGHIDNHWWERIGAAILLSLVDDAIALQTAKQGAEATQAGGSSLPYQATTTTTKGIAEKVLDSTINIAPTLTKSRGERLLVMVNRDLWFDQVYDVRSK